MFERLLKRPPAGLSVAEQAKLGSLSAQASVSEVLNQRPPAGLSLIELAAIGLESAKEKVQKVIFPSQ